MDLQWMVGIGMTLMSAIFGVVVWGLHLEGRVNTQEALRLALDKQLSDRHADVIARLERIERKQDTANNGTHK